MKNNWLEGITSLEGWLSYTPTWQYFLMYIRRWVMLMTEIWAASWKTQQGQAQRRWSSSSRLYLGNYSTEKWTHCGRHYCTSQTRIRTVINFSVVCRMESSRWFNASFSRCSHKCNSNFICTWTSFFPSPHLSHSCLWFYRNSTT